MHKLHFQLATLAVLVAAFWSTEAVAYDRYYGDAGVYYPYSQPVYSYTYSEVRVYGAAPYAPGPPVARYYGDAYAAGYYGGPRGYDNYYSHYSAPRAYGYRYRYGGNGRCNRGRY